MDIDPADDGGMDADLFNTNTRAKDDRQFDKMDVDLKVNEEEKKLLLGII